MDFCRFERQDKLGYTGNWQAASYRIVRKASWPAEHKSYYDVVLI